MYIVCPFREGINADENPDCKLHPMVRTSRTSLPCHSKIWNNCKVPEYLLEAGWRKSKD